MILVYVCFVPFSIPLKTYIHMILFNKLIPERKNIRVRSGSTGATDTSSHDIIHGRQLCLHSSIVCDALNCATFTYFCLGFFFLGTLHYGSKV